MPRHRPARRGFIFLFGSRNVISADGKTVTAVCPRCQRQSSILGKSIRHWFTLFFVPVFPLGAKRPFCECSSCKAQFPMTLDDLSQRVTSSQAQQAQQAISMYNSMRASPANSVTLNNLMLLYASLQEFEPAVSAAREFPQALNASEQCMTTLGRILLEQARHADALKWFDAALARDPMQGEAAYYKAITLMGMLPPDLPGALSAARMSRTAAYPNADALLKEIESRSRVA